MFSLDFQAPEIAVFILAMGPGESGGRRLKIPRQRLHSSGALFSKGAACQNDDDGSLRLAGTRR